VVGGDAYECLSEMRSHRARGARDRALALLACGVVLALSPAAAIADSHVFSATFGGAGAGAGQFASGNGATSPSGVAVNDATGDVYVADPGNARIDQFDTSGAFVRAWGWGVADGFTEAPQTCAFTCFAGMPGYGTPGQLFGPTFVAVDNSGGPSQGDVYVADANNTITVSKFDSAGNPVAGWGSEGQLGGFEGVAGIAVDGDGHLWVLAQTGVLFEYDQSGGLLREVFVPNSGKADGIAVDGAHSLYLFVSSGAVLKASETGTVIGTVTAGPATGVAVDPLTNDLYVDRGTSIEHFTAACDPAAGPCAAADSFGSPALTAATGIAVDAASGAVYAGDGAVSQVDRFDPAVLPRVVTGSASVVQPTSATLDGTVDAEGVPVTDCHFEYGATTAYGQAAQCVETVGSGTGDVRVHADVAGLQPRTAYHFRLDAANANGIVDGSDQVFSTTAPPAVDGQSAENVTPTEARLRAQINPGNADTTYHFEYGTSSSYGSSAPVPDADLGSGHTDQLASTQLTGLQPGTTYHYRVLARNALAATGGPDQTFTTFAPATAGLPDGRAYELVSPSDHGSGSISPEVPAAVAADGQHVLYQSATVGSFGDANNSIQVEYLATRGSGGWRSTSVSNLVPPHPHLFDGEVALDGSADFSTLFYNMDPRTSGDANDQNNSQDVYERAADGSYVWVSQNGGLSTGPVPSSYAGNSADGRHALFQTAQALTPDDAGQAAGEALYDRVAGHTLLVGVNTDGSLTSACGAVLGDGFTSSPSQANAVSSDGARIFFESPDPAGSGDASCPPAAGGTQPVEVYVRENAADTVQISRSQKTGAGGLPAPNGATYQGASSDGSRAFFTSPDQLTDDASAALGGLYGYDLNTGLLTFIGRGAPLRSVALRLMISSDGSRVYFTGEVPGVGPDNSANGGSLYLWDAGRISYIAPAPTENAGDNVPRDAGVSADGSTLAFTTTGSLTGYDARGHTEIYVYRSSEGSLVCVTCDPTGAPPRGSGPMLALNAGRFLAGGQSVSADGRIVFFDTPTALVAQDTNTGANPACGLTTQGDGHANTGCDVYEYEDGTVHLLSRGTGYPSFLVGASAEGRDVIIETADSLTPLDQNNGQVDLYDVRIGGGFPSDVATAPCEGDACQGPLTVAPPTSTVASATFAGPGNLIASVARPAAPKPKRPTRSQELAMALKACGRKLAGGKRAACIKHARKRYGVKPGANKTARRRA
jgi:hypothetical protein